MEVRWNTPQCGETCGYVSFIPPSQNSRNRASSAPMVRASNYQKCCTPSGYIRAVAIFRV
eukprot:1499722-Prymnesium_polylepis.1